MEGGDGAGVIGDVGLNEGFFGDLEGTRGVVGACEDIGGAGVGGCGWGDDDGLAGTDCSIGLVLGKGEGSASSG